MKTIAMGIVALLSAVPASAQPPTERARVVWVDAGFARTLDDEGVLGTGTAVGVGAGYRLTPRVTIQALVQHIPYYRDVESLTFDGRMLFAGMEVEYRSQRPRVRPFVAVGAGMMNDDRVWIHKSLAGPGFTRVNEQTEHRYTVTMMTAATGLDVELSGRASIRLALRWHGLLDTGDDLAPHTILQPAIGAAWRW